MHDAIRPGGRLGEEPRGHGMSQDTAYDGLWQSCRARNLTVACRAIDRNSREEMELIEHIDDSGVILDLSLVVIMDPLYKTWKESDIPPCSA